MKCENSSDSISNIINPQCWKGKVTKRVTVTYNEVESDTLHLCVECAGYVSKDARRHGYKVRKEGI